MSQLRVRFRHLQTFLEVARQKSVSTAAEMLHVSQPAVTKTIRELEAVLGTKLVEKDGRGIRITRQGEVFLRHAGTSVAAIQQGIDSVKRELGGRGPTVRVGALPTVSARVMPKAVELFLKEESGTGIRVVTGENTVMLNQLRVGDLDMVVGRLAAPELMQGLAFEHLYSEQIAFVVRKGHPLLASDKLAFDRIGEFPVLMPPPGSVIRPFVDRFLITHGLVDLPTLIETVSDSFGRAFVRSNDAVWIISFGVVANEVAQGSFATLPVDTSETRGSVGLTTRGDATLSPQMIMLMQTIRDVTAQEN
ncbi:pca operon transcription factor PcaQ [Mariluticola halotolerans]|uniref:pca operon transcription factor PcaQ n=1 Tax=Mariluticola halotolerans TaxID=2909283 RepID=UPI0026E1E0ED|nr:pca operon transcription factor PcaQ [Mariluticola halotolerans]UJQ95696.1 pca operon transcription factor PcaQ [Mariluticola halotolerans]